MTTKEDGVKALQITEGWLKIIVLASTICGTIIGASIWAGEQWKTVLETEGQVQTDLPALKKNITTLTTVTATIQTEVQQDHQRIEWMARQNGYRDGHPAKVVARSGGTE